MLSTAGINTKKLLNTKSFTLLWKPDTIRLLLDA